ncbi:MAG TPA: type II CAAX endopeptidase family protein [Tepidisphaeraceae bacterium]|nr:type II CAAX endopeptidase family protein [Tepidisphaeraceae bacterium]
MAQQQVAAGGILFLLLATMVALVAAHAIGVFSRQALPPLGRLSAGERPGTLALIFFAALVTWICTPAFYISFQRIPATTQGPFILSARDTVILNAIGSLLALAVLILGNQFYRSQGLSRLGFSLRRLISAIPKGILGIVIVLPLLAWVTIFTMLVWRLVNLTHPEKHELLVILDKTHDPRLAILLVITAVIIAPIYEELFFRGHLQTIIRYYVGRPWPAILLTAGAFSIVHPPWTWPPIFFLALCLGYAYERTNNLWVAIIIHALFNATSVAMSLLMPQ